LSGVDDSHVETGTYRVKKKCGVHRFAHGVVATKRKRNVAHSATHARAGKILFDPARCFDEIERVIAVFFKTSRDGQNVWIENDVAGGKPGLLG